MSLTIKKILAVLGFVAVAILAVTRAGADCPNGDVLWLSGTAYVNSSGRVWVELTPTPTEDGSTCKSECEDEGAFTSVGYAAATIRRPGAVNTTGVFTPGDLWSSYGIGSGASQNSCPWFQVNIINGNSGAWDKIEEMFESGVPSMIYLGDSDSGTFSNLGCGDRQDPADYCLGVIVGAVAFRGSAAYNIAWECSIVVGSAPSGCHPECQELEKPAGPGTPVRPSTWGRVKGLWR